MESIAKLRAKLADQWGALDTDGDGKVGGEELVQALDADGDGKVDAAEMAALSRQLQEQSDYTAYLIAQLQRMEEAQLAAQKEAAQKEAALRHTFAAADKARAEANELGRRLEISQEVLQKMSEQCKQARVEAGAARREAARLRAAAEEAEAGRAAAEAAARQAAAQRGGEGEGLPNGAGRGGGVDSGAQLRGSRSPDTATHTQAAKVAAQQRVVDEALSGQARAEAEVARLRLDMAAGQAALLQLGEEADKAKAATKAVQAKLAAAEQQLDKLQAGSRSTAASAAQLRERLADEEAKVVVLQHEVSSAKDAASLKDMELASLKQRMAVQLAEAQALAAENQQLRQELEDVGVDYLAQAKARAQEKAQAERAIREARDERNRIAAEARRREQDVVSTNARRADEYAAQLSEAQKRIQELQEQVGAAQDRSSQLQAEAEAAGAKFGHSLAAADERAQQLQRALDDALKTAAEDRTKARDTASALAAKVLDARKNSVLVAETHMASLSALQDALRALGSECATSRDDFSAVAGTLRSLQRSVLAVSAQQQGPLEDWYTGVKATFLSMLDAVGDAEERMEAAQDSAANDSVRVEEGRQQILMLQEQVSSLTHELSLQRTRNHEASAEGEHTEAQLREAVAQETKMRQALQDQVSTTSQALAKANDRIVALQEAASSATARIADAHAEHSRRVAALEESLRAAQQDVRVKEQLYQAALAGKREVESQSEAVTTDASKRLDQYLAKQQALRQQLTDTEAKASTAEARASRLAQQLQRSERQLQQTQSLLMVVREQKDQLQDERRAAGNDAMAAALGVADTSTTAASGAGVDSAQDSGLGEATAGVAAAVDDAPDSATATAAPHHGRHHRHDGSHRHHDGHHRSHRSHRSHRDANAASEVGEQGLGHRDARADEHRGGDGDDAGPSTASANADTPDPSS